MRDYGARAVFPALTGQRGRGTDRIDEAIDMRLDMRRLWEALTDAEREIVMAASAVHSAETAGRILGLAPKTVNNRAYEIAAKWRAIQAES